MLAGLGHPGLNSEVRFRGGDLRALDQTIEVADIEEELPERRPAAAGDGQGDPDHRNHAQAHPLAQRPDRDAAEVGAGRLEIEQAAITGHPGFRAQRGHNGLARG